jgi:hypothetical protein
MTLPTSRTARHLTLSTFGLCSALAASTTWAQPDCDHTCAIRLDAQGEINYLGGVLQVRPISTSNSYTLTSSPYRDATGLAADWRLTLDSGNQISLGGTTSYKNRYPALGALNQNAQTNALSVGWLMPLGDGSTLFSLTAAGGVELSTGGRDDGDKQFFGPRALLQRSFNDRWGAYVTFGATRARYVGTNSLYGFAREESLYDLSLGITWAVSKGVSVRPQFTYMRNVSNAELYGYDKSDASIKVRLDY